MPYSVSMKSTRRPSANPASSVAAQTSSASQAPESWVVRVEDSNVATLNIPGLLGRARTFDIDVQLQVRVPESGRACEMGLSLEIDGAQQWSRSAPGLTPGQVDGLDYHCRRVLEPEQQMRLRARAQVKGGGVVRLVLSAVEDRSG